MRVLGLVPARGGSKGVPRKNVRALQGRPLLAWTAEAALAARGLARVVLSTDDEAIAEVGRACGLEVPFVREPALARDDTPMLPVVLDAVRRLEAAGDAFDAVCLLQPTNPLRTSGDIEACLQLLRESGADCVVTVLPVPHAHNPHWVYLGEPGERLVLATGEAQPIARRQALPSAWHREGSVYVTRRGALAAGSLYGTHVVGHPIDPARSVNIDDLDDWARAEALLAADVAGVS